MRHACRTGERGGRGTAPGRACSKACRHFAAYDPGPDPIAARGRAPRLVLWALQRGGQRGRAAALQQQRAAQARALLVQRGQAAARVARGRQRARHIGRLRAQRGRLVAAPQQLHRACARALAAAGVG